MCEINKPGYKFAPIFDAADSGQEDPAVTANWPSWLVKKEIGTAYVPTVDLPQVGNSKKTVDLLTVSWWGGWCAI